MDAREIKFIIGNISPFNKLKERNLNRLVDLCGIREYKNSEVIYEEGSPPGYFYFLLKGRVEVLTKKEGQDHKIEILKRGAFFGVISLLTDALHSVTTKSIENSVVLRIDNGKFKDFLRGNPSVSLELSRILSQRVKARSKPKRIFESKKIGILGGNEEKSQLSYMFNLGLALKEQTAKNVLCVIIGNYADDDVLRLGLAGINPAHDPNKCIKVKTESEQGILESITMGKIDYMYISLEKSDDLSSLLNFLSESYHFIIYCMSKEFFNKYKDDFIKLAHQLHFIFSPKKAIIDILTSTVKDLKMKRSYNEDKIRVIASKDDLNKGFSPNKIKKLINHPISFLANSYDRDDLGGIAREVGGITLGVALGSGAAYGFSHIGVLKVLSDSKATIDVVCGSSMGAVMAALWAVGFSFGDIENIAQDLGKRLGSFSIFGFSLPPKGIMRSRRLERIFKDIFRDLTFYDLKNKLKIVAFDFLKRKVVILEEGPLYKAVAASCAFPGIFAPVKLKKDLLLDGGILNPLPTKVLLNYGVHKIIAVNTTLSKEQAFREYKKRKQLHIFDFIFGSIETMQQQFIEQALKIADVVIHPNLEGLGWTEFERIPEFIKRGEKAALERKEDIQKLIRI